MSLIYSAIGSLEKQPEAGAAEPHVFARMPPAVRGTPPRWLYVAGIGSVSAVVLGGVALMALRDHASAAPSQLASAPAQAVAAPQRNERQPTPLADAKPAPQNEMPPAQSASAPPMYSVKAAEPAPFVAPVKEAMAAKEPVGVKELVGTKPRAEQKLVAKLEAAAHSAPRTPPVQVEAAPEQAKPAGVDLNRLASAAKQAIDAGNQAEAEAALGQLAAHLPPESITLLRLRAWQAQRNDEQPRALELYRQIVERLPEDETASINLAVLTWKAGQIDEARRIVANLAERRPDSETVRRYLAQFGERR